MQIFGLSTARLEINQIPCHFSGNESVFTYILHQLSVSWQIIPLKFFSWTITLWTKRAHQITNFEISECFNESSPNSSCQFWNHKVKVYSNFALLFSVTKDNSSAFFFISNLYTLDKKSPSKWKFWVLGWKITKFLMSYLKLQVKFSLKFASLFSVMRDNSSVLSFRWNCTWFRQKEPIKVQDFRLLTAHLFDFWLLLLKVYRNFC